MRPLFALALVTQLGCWSEQTFRDACLDAGHCSITDSGSGGSMGGGGGAIGGGGGSIGGGGGALGGGGGSIDDAGFDAGADAGPEDAGIDAGLEDAGVDAGGAITWADVVADLFSVPLNLDAGFDLELKPVPDAGAGGIWIGGVLTPGGSVLCIPYQGKVLEITPSRDLNILLSGGGFREGGVLLHDGGVLALPNSSTGAFEVTSTTDLDLGLPIAGANFPPFFEGGVITLSEKVLLAPQAEVNAGVIDVAAGTLTLLDAGVPLLMGGTNRFFAGAVLRADGESAILIPRHSRQALIVTPTSARLLPATDLQGHGGGLLMPNGSVLMMALENSAFALVNPTDGGVTFPSGLTRSGYFSAAWSTNGYAYAMQTGGGATGNIAIIDRNAVISEIPFTDGGIFTNSHYGLTAMKDGTLVACPYGSNNVLFITPYTRRSSSIPVMTSPWLNKW